MNSASPGPYESLSPDEAARVDEICDRFEQSWREYRAGGELPSVIRCVESTCAIEPAVRAVLIRELIEIDRACRVRYGASVPQDEYELLGVCLTEDMTVDPSKIMLGAGVGAAASKPQIPGMELGEIIGYGGMGVVFRARQTGLDREVAVKIVRDVRLGESAMHERFAQEARAIARLQHPNLVQVYDYGQVPGFGQAMSQPYLVMEYVAGGSLADSYRGVPQRPLAAARLVEQLADAIHFAHQQGIIHRDLKPSNILLATEATSRNLAPRDPSRDAMLAPSSLPRPKVTDFGLAKFQAGTDLTRTGDVLGTPSYMAPEQTKGKHGDVTPAVDVYGLGAILYELLTGRPPFQAETAVATLLQVQFDEPIPPQRLQPTVPRDLEVICLKCLRKEPRQRYASASDLGDDLRRFQQGEPIRARPAGVGERVARWCRRKPLVAALSAALVLVFAGGLCGVLWQWNRARELAVVAERNAEDFKRERDVAQRERDRAERHLQRVRSKVDRLAQLGRELWDDPRLSKTGEAVLEEALAFYREILPEEGSDPLVRWEMARLFHQVGQIQATLGRWSKSVQTFEQETALLDELTAADPNDLAYRRQLAKCHRFRAVALASLEQPIEAIQAYDQAVRHYEWLLRQQGDDADLKMELGNALLNKAVVLSKHEDAEEIERLYGRILELEEAALQTAPVRDDYRGELALALEGHGTFYMATGRPAEALPLFQRTLTIRQGFVEGAKRGRMTALYVARAHGNLGDALFALRRRAEADQAYNESLTILEKASRDFPDVPRYRIALARLLRAVADMMPESRRGETADFQDRAIEVYRKLVEESPEDIDSRLQLGVLLDLTGRGTEGIAQLRKVLEIRPDFAPGKNSLAWALANSPDPSVRQPEEAVQLAQEAVAADGKRASFWNTLGVAQFRYGDYRSAKVSLTRSMELGRGGTPFDWFFLAMICCRDGDAAQARTWFAKAVDEMPLSTHGPELVRIRDEVRAMLTEMGVP